MYQGLSDCFLPGHADVPLPSEADGIDFEGEYGVITDAVPMGITVDIAIGDIKLLLLINDWSLRAIVPVEMKTGFGWAHAKQPCSVAPFAITPDELGDAWQRDLVAGTIIGSGTMCQRRLCCPRFILRVRTPRQRDDGEWDTSDSLPAFR